MGAPPPPPPPPPPGYPPPPPPGYGAPPPVYSPYGVPPPVVVVVAPSMQETKAGVRGISTAMLIYMIVQAIAFAFFLYLFLVVIPLLISSPTMSSGAALGLLAGVGIGGCAIVILYIVCLIIGLLGFIKVRSGAKEFGPEHDRSVEQGTIFIVISIVVSIASSVAQFFIPSLLAAIVVSGVTGFISAFLFAIGMVRLVEKLADPKEKANLNLFFYISTAAQVVGITVAAVALVLMAGATSLTSFSGAGSLLGVGSIVTLIAFFFGWSAYKSIAERLESGALRPLMPQIPGMPMPGMVFAGAPPTMAPPPPPPPGP